MSPTRHETISSHPIGDQLDEFRGLFDICEPIAADEGEVNNIRPKVLRFLLALPTLPACDKLLSTKGSGPLYIDILRLATDFDIVSLLPLLKVVRDKESDEVIWNKVYEAVAAATPPPRAPLSFPQTPSSRNTGTSTNSNEYRVDMDILLKGGAGRHAIFERCKEGDDPIYREDTGWTGWPEGAPEEQVLAWMSRVISKLIELYEEQEPGETVQRRPLALPNQPLKGSTAERKLDIGFMNGSAPLENGKYAWSQILVPGELKNKPGLDIKSRAWLDLGRYAREVLASQDSRRFVLGFTLCGSRMRLWLFDRLGGIGSERFDIHEDGLRFISVLLTYLLMSEEQLGFDPTIVTDTEEDLRYITIERDDREERLIIDEMIKRTACIAGRATTCWKVHRDGESLSLVVKDSWQYPERDEEGELLREVTEKGVINVARYYHHETVQVGGRDDDVCNGVRKGLDITTASNYMTASSRRPENVSRSSSRTGKKSSRTTSRKRSSTNVEPSLPPSKRTQSRPPYTSPSLSTPPPSNRIHRRVIIQDYGKPIYEASSKVALLAALEGCIKGYESLHQQAGILQSDISPNNLMINEDGGSLKSFIIDLDLAIKEDRVESSGARGKTGTQAFMAIGVLLGEKHSFMHDLESFFWVLFWICIHYHGPLGKKTVTVFEEWNYISTEKLAKEKKGEINVETDFLESATKHFTEYYQPLVRWVNKLRRVVFPDGGRWKTPNENLYSSMTDLLREAQMDPKVIGS
ncbi:conserved hypothetical protein [Microsporum canis CBS 113480]|uniref:Fungal-type protein kinase domain-containing protein n=1 Tax=Arthroderma otae (strain ATCC MYA-4605 / CBS 113480) TaxID=554155 RepID=C5FGP9_ARTOC|nr:conserved hypothetical protein [Microsporum canis CBS 113480]EEQ29934.1 conserved hypothetical protein [Microsporum canis CBS 113480]